MTEVNEMHKLYELKEMLVEELEKYGDKKDLSAGDLAIVDTLSHSIKNLCKVIEDMDEGASGRYPMYYGDDYGDGMRGGMRGTRYSDGQSNARRRRDSMGRYSREEYSRAADDVIQQLEDMMDSAPDERTKMKVKDLIREMKKV